MIILVYSLTKKKNPYICAAENISSAIYERKFLIQKTRVEHLRCFSKYSYSKNSFNFYIFSYWQKKYKPI